MHDQLAGLGISNSSPPHVVEASLETSPGPSDLNASEGPFVDNDDELLSVSPPRDLILNDDSFHVASEPSSRPKPSIYGLRNHIEQDRRRSLSQDDLDDDFAWLDPQLNHEATLPEHSAVHDEPDSDPISNTDTFQNAGNKNGDIPNSSRDQNLAHLLDSTLNFDTTTSISTTSRNDACTPQLLPSPLITGQSPHLDATTEPFFAEKPSILPTPGFSAYMSRSPYRRPLSQITNLTPQNLRSASRTASQIPRFSPVPLVSPANSPRPVLSPSTNSKIPRVLR